MSIEALILKKQFSGEYNQVITCYTKERGKLVAIAKSSLKPVSKQALHLDVLNLVHFRLVEGKNLPIITGAEVQNAFQNIRLSIPATSVAFFALEALDKLSPERQTDSSLWHLVVETLNHLDRQPVCADMNFFREIQQKLLACLGYGYNRQSAVQNNNYTLLHGAFEGAAMRRFDSFKFAHQVLTGKI